MKNMNRNHTFTSFPLFFASLKMIKALLLFCATLLLHEKCFNFHVIHKQYALPVSKHSSFPDATKQLNMKVVLST